MNEALSQEVATAGAVALSAAALQLAAASISPRTQALYRRELDRVRADCEPLTDATLAEHLTRRHRDGAAPSTLALTVAAVRFAAKLRGRPRPDGPAVALVLDGIRRNGRNRGRGQVKGLTWSQADLAAAVAANGGASLAGRRDAALIALQSDAMLRVSELVALDVTDVQAEADGSGRVTVAHSKTDQEGRGAVLYLRRVTMRRIQNWTAASGLTAGPLFRRVYRGGKRAGTAALSTAAARSILKRRAADAGLDASRISGHSARVGAAQSLVRHGATVPELQQVGRWKSSAMPAHYARAELAGRSAVARLREDS